MSDMKCPFCQQELNIDPCGEMGCPNEKCKESVFLIGTKELWQELIRTRKALDVAVDALKKYKADSGNWWYGYEFQGNYEDCAGEHADKALEQITAPLENQNGNC